MALYHGKKGVVYLSTTGAGTAVSATALNSWSLSASTDKVEVTAFGDTNKTYVIGLPDYQGSISGFWDDTYDDLFDGAGSSTAIKMYLYPSSDAPTKYWYGTAWVDYQIDCSNSEAVSISATFAAASSWGRL